MAKAKISANEYGIWLIMSGRKAMKAVETNRAGVHHFIADQLGKGQYAVSKLPDIEFVNEEETFPRNVVGMTGGKVNCTTPVPKKVAPKAAKSRPILTAKKSKAQIQCPGSSKAMYSYAGMRVKCPHCKRLYMVTRAGQMRKHFA